MTFDTLRQVSVSSIKTRTEDRDRTHRREDVPVCLNGLRSLHTYPLLAPPVRRHSFLRRMSLNAPHNPYRSTDQTPEPPTTDDLESLSDQTPSRQRQDSGTTSHDSVPEVDKEHPVSRRDPSTTTSGRSDRSNPWTKRRRMVLNRFVQHL